MGSFSIAIVHQVTLVVDDFNHLLSDGRDDRLKGWRDRHIFTLANVQVNYRADESCASLHGAQTSVSDLKGQDLGTRGHAIALRFLWEVTRSNACNMCSMGTFSKQQAI